MELEKAIKILKYQLATRNTDIYTPINYEAIETVLNQLDSLKFKYQARKDRTDTIIKKQEKMIELMAIAISSYDGQLVINQYKDRNEVKAKFEEYVEDGTYEQYFEKKAEE